jgi:hypothetical protein
MVRMLLAIYIHITYPYFRLKARGIDNFWIKNKSTIILSSHFSGRMKKGENQKGGDRNKGKF